MKLSELQDHLCDAFQKISALVEKHGISSEHLLADKSLTINFGQQTLILNISIVEDNSRRYSTVGTVLLKNQLLEQRVHIHKLEFFETQEISYELAPHFEIYSLNKVLKIVTNLDENSLIIKNLLKI